MELFEQDFYRVESNNIRVDFPAFFALYQPLLHSDGAALYATLYAESRADDFAMHSRLCRLCALDIDEIQAARERLEQFGLLKTYCNALKGEYVYRLAEPLSAMKFLSHAVYGLQYQSLIGPNEYERSKSIYAPSQLKLSGYKEITRKLDKEALLSGLSEHEVKQFLSNKQEEVSTDKSFGFDSEFDYQEFIKPLTNLAFPYEARTTENLRFIGRLSSITRIDMNRLREYACQAINMKDNTLNKDLLMKKVMQNLTVPQVSDPYFLDPFTFLKSKQNGVEVSKGSRMALEYLVNDTYFSSEVVNVIVEFILEANNSILNLNYTQSVAETFARENVKTREEALFLVKKLKKEKQMKTKREVKIHQPTYTRYDEDEDEAERQEALRQFEKLRDSEQ
ncbi:MAG: DnaD domain protein [Erysipelotrichaceae bacterium]|nr:DnaD domain protein [Erysipelotrichaceae bacterium]